MRGDGVELAYLACGEGPLALCLHGFPDSAHTWRHLLPELADAGYLAVAPFLRGYAPSGLDDAGRYQNGAEVADALAIHEQLGGGQPGVLIGLAVSGDDIRQLGFAGPRVGEVLGALLDRVLDDPSLNSRERLLELARELG